ncbi:ABC transporter permease [Dictyobacter kobayashii]|uniref:ABC transporter permease n=1 Tax=Dictyobacter kobayashii TaxID=2014872 RepID=A0A402ACB3_9CHLR|nr:ABC-2 family transporter protein [Dictyobacter kobayashii]GCE16729.1 hypothetical protein KDK_05290 [Dictyobacter kobayashii]
MKIYLRLLRIFYTNALMSEFEYRLNFWSNIGMSFFWLIVSIFSINIFFLHTQTIAGWNYYNLLVVLGLFFAMNGYQQMVLQPNLSRLSEYVRLGTFDYVLTKPVNSQFFISLRNIGINNVSDPLFGIGLIIYGLYQSHNTPNLLQVLFFILLMISAMIILYSLNLIIHIPTFWLVNLDQIDILTTRLLETARFPLAFYQNPLLRNLLTFVIPVAFMTTFPAQALLGRSDWPVVLGAVLLASTLFTLSAAFWRFALIYYSGASS